MTKHHHCPLDSSALSCFPPNNSLSKCSKWIPHKELQLPGHYRIRSSLEKLIRKRFKSKAKDLSKSRKKEEETKVKSQILFLPSIKTVPFYITEVSPVIPQVLALEHQMFSFSFFSSSL